MIVVVSKQAVKNGIGNDMPGNIPVDKWLVVKKIPVEKQQIILLLKKNKCVTKNGRLIFFVNSGEQQPAAFPGLFVDNWLLSLVFFKCNDELSNWLKALKDHSQNQTRRTLVLGMMKPFYIKWADRIYGCFQQERHLNGNTFKYLPDTTSNAELAKKLSQGCSLAIYVGHGRSRGWSGYRGFRWDHMEKTVQKKPVGILISFSCNGLKKDKIRSSPFGLKWVTEGRACTSIASCESLQIRPLEAITTAFMESVLMANIFSVDDLLFAINEKLKKMNDPDVETNWQHFRLIGNPFQLFKQENQNAAFNV